MALTKIQSHNLDTQDSVAITSLVANGSTGTSGQVLTTDGANTYWSTVISGVKGDAGVKGDKGDNNGPKGDKGDAGSKGDTGAAGAYDVTLNSFTGNGSNTAYTLSTAPTDENHTIVTIYGVTQHKSTYSLSANTITFSEAPPTSAPIEVMVIAGGAKGEPGTYAGKGDKGDAGTSGSKGDKGEGIVYPSAGIAVSDGTGWGTSKTTPSGTIVGTTDVQTLASKTLSANSTTVDSDGTGYTIGYRRVPQNTQSSGYTIINSDEGKHVYYTGGAATLTIPVDGATTGGDFEIGTTFTTVNNGTANLTISIASGGTMYHAGTSNTGNRTLAVKGMVTALKVAGNTWFISGAGLT